MCFHPLSQEEIHADPVPSGAVPVVLGQVIAVGGGSRLGGSRLGGSRLGGSRLGGGTVRLEPKIQIPESTPHMCHWRCVARIRSNRTR